MKYQVRVPVRLVYEVEADSAEQAEVEALTLVLSESEIKLEDISGLLQVKEILS